MGYSGQKRNITIMSMFLIQSINLTMKNSKDQELYQNHTHKPTHNMCSSQK